ncbi:MAG: hypothetical protein KGL04_07870 [Elusimicrobia bacterium]|nr:hypothetical protein [Elusimicrobiota bacterium]MDE2314076.1 hypothetical protein [Elusimicrobiota bacterium]
MRTSRAVLGLWACVCLPMAAAAQPSGFAALESLRAQAGFSQRPMGIARLQRRLAEISLEQPHDVPLTSAQRPLAEVPLPRILDAIKNTNSTFIAGGVRVHVFGIKSLQNSWFLGFWPENSANPILVRGKEMIHHWPFWSGTLHPRINGESYSVYIQAKILSPMQSNVILSPKHGPRTVFTIAQLVENAYEAGYPVRIAGQDYRVFYNRDFTQNASGDFGGYTGERSIVFLYKDGDSAKGFQFFESRIPHGTRQILVSTPSEESSDQNASGNGLTLGLRIDYQGNLQIYYPAPQP